MIAKKMTDKNELEICFVLFSTFELMLSNYAEDDVLNVSVMLTTPDGEIVMSPICT